MNTKHESWHFQGLILFTSSNLYILTSFILVSTVIIMFCIKFKFKLPPKKLNTLKQRNKTDDKELDNGIIHLKRNSGQKCVNTKTESWNQTPDKSSPNSPLPSLPQSSIANSPQIPTTSSPSSPSLPLPSLPINQYPPQEHYHHPYHPANHPYSHSSYETIVNGNLSSRRTQGKQKLPPYKTHPIPFTTWLIKITQKLLHWKNDFVNRTSFNVSTQFNCQCKPMNDKYISHDSNSTPMQRKMSNSNNNNFMDKGQLNEDRILFDSLQIKRKANSMKEEMYRKQNISPFWINNTNHIVQSYSTIIASSHPTTNCRPSPFRHFDSSQSDLFDPIYSVIQYPLNAGGTLQSTHSLSPSSVCNYSEGSVNGQRQFIEPHRLLAKDIWTSQVIISVFE
ncbi:unnamed protein product [Trichobilharzia szidati]|nr:unnamed protein product [Trichobilharzia szidati]